MLLSSLQNPRLKELSKLRQGKSSYWANGFIVEGEREIVRAINQGFRCLDFFAATELKSAAEAELLAKIKQSGTAIQLVSNPIFAQLVMRESTIGVLAVLEQRHLKLKDLKIGSQPLLLALEGLEKPGNIGALLRSADGAEADAIISLDGKVNYFHHNVVRASTGAVFSVPVVSANAAELLAYCSSHKIQVVAASPEAKKSYYETDLSGAVCFVLGAEDQGLGELWRSANGIQVNIPMRGICDSLNVSVSGAILLYEARRQRQAFSKG